MKNVVITLDKNKGRAKAKDYFMEMCGYYTRDNVKQKQIDASLSSLDDIYEDIHVKAIISKYGSGCVRDDKLTCGDTTFNCRALSQVAEQDVLNVYIYLLTIGEININCERVLQQVYYDLWQTAYVDVGRDLLKEYIANSVTYSPFSISDSFGPGFFGMPVTDTKKFFHILDGAQIGADIRPSGFIVPGKSYAGFFLITTKEEALPSKDCENCISSRKTCIYCKSGRSGNPALSLNS